jgi:DNA-directed RNA polymerase subunit RPC12/RpoP
MIENKLITKVRNIVKTMGRWHFLVRKCGRCGKLVWFWESRANISLKTKNGEEKILHLCFYCGIEFMKQIMETERM